MYKCFNCINVIQCNLIVPSFADIAEWDEPKAGLFFWIKLKQIKDTKELIEQKAAQKQAWCTFCICHFLE